MFAVVDERDVPALLRIRRLGRLHVQMAPERLDHAIEILVKQARMRGK